MTGSSGSDGSGSFARSVITATPGTARFDRVWLIGEAFGRQAASPNVGVILDDAGLTVTGPAPGQSNTIPWTWVKQFSIGPAMTFPDQKPATVVEVVLVGRTILLLVPTDQLSESEIAELNRYLPNYEELDEPAAPLPMEDTQADTETVDLGTPIIEDHVDDREAGIGEKVEEPTVPERRPRKKRSKVRGIEKIEDPQEEPHEEEQKAERAPSALNLRNFRLALLLAGLVVVAVLGTIIVAIRIHNNQNPSAGVVIPQSTPTTAAPSPSTLSGPPATASAQTVASTVNLTLGDLPAGWTKVTALPPESSPSPFADTQSTANSDLAACIRLPLSHIGILTGATEPGGPQVWPSNAFVTSAGLKPSAISVTSLESTVGVEQSDLSALVGPNVPRCLDDYYATSFANDHITTPPIVNRFAVPQHAGEEVIGLDVHIGIAPNGHPEVYDYDVVVIGAGRIETAVGAQQNDEPFPATTLSSAVSSIETRAAQTAGGK